MKKSLKFWLLGICATTAVAATSPLIVACGNTISTKKPVYDDVTKTLWVQSNHFFTSDKTVFNIFNVLYTSDKNHISNIAFDQIIASLKTNLTKMLQTYVDEYKSLLEKDIKFNFTNVQFVNGNQLSFNCSSINSNIHNVSPINIVIEFPLMSTQQINKYMADNSSDQYRIKLNDLYSTNSLEDVKNLSNDEIISLAGNKLPPNVVLFNKSDDSNLNAWGIQNYQIIDDKVNNEQFLKIAIFVPNRNNNSKGLSWLEIYKEYSQITDIPPSNSLLDQVPAVENHWPEIAEKIMTPLENITNFNIIENGYQHGEILSYREAIKLQDVQTKIKDYKNSDKIVNNLIHDVDYYLRNYVYYLGTEWENHNIAYQDIFAFRKFSINEQGKISGQIIFEIHNRSDEAKTILLPFNNNKQTLNPFSVASFIITISDLDVQGALSEHLTTKNLGYLTIAFNNTKVEWFITSENAKTHAKTNEYQIIEPTKLFNYSNVLNTLVTNVGDGEDILSQEQILNASYQSLTVDDLKYSKYNQINNEFTIFLDIFRSLQNVMLNIAKNPSVFEFLKSLNNEIYNVVNALTKNSDLSWIVADLFSNKKLSEFLHANIESIIQLVESIDKTGDLTTIVEMLKDIANSNPTLEEKEAWVKSIVGLYPTLEKLMGGNLAISWVLPLLKIIMTYISDKNPPVIDLVFENIDKIINFINQNQGNISVPENVKNLLTSLMSFLDEIINFSQITGSDKTEQYKQIKLLDIVSYEVTKQNKSSSLFSLIAEIARLIDPTNTISATLTTLATDLGTKYKLPDVLEDYSKAQYWDNHYNWLGIFQNYRILTDQIKRPKLSEHLGEVINTIINVKFLNNNEKTTFYDVLAKHTKATIKNGIENNFTFDKANKTITQTFEIQYTTTRDIEIDLLPIHTLVDNLDIQGAPTTPKSYVSGSHTIIFPRKHIDVSKLGTGVPSGILSTLGLKEIGLSQALPRNLIVKKDRAFVNHKTISKNEKIYPTISQNGVINWMYNSSTEVDVSYNNIFNDSNVHPSENKYQEKYYADIYNNYTRGMLIDGKIRIGGFLPISVGFLFKMNDTITSFAPISTNLQNKAHVIPNYNSNIYIPGTTITLNKTMAELQTDLNTYITSNTGWTKNSFDGDTFIFDKNFDITQYFEFGTAFTNQYIGYFYGFNMLKMDIIMKTQMKYSLSLGANQTFLFTYKDQAGNNVSQLMNSNLMFNIQ